MLVVLATLTRLLAPANNYRVIADIRDMADELRLVCVSAPMQSNTVERERSSVTREQVAAREVDGMQGHRRAIGAAQGTVTTALRGRREGLGHRSRTGASVDSIASAGHNAIHYTLEHCGIL